MIKLNVKVIAIHHTDKDKKHDFDLVVEDLNTTNSQIWVQVRRTQSSLMDNVNTGDRILIECTGEYGEQVAKNAKVYRHNNLILHNIKEVDNDLFKSISEYSDEDILCQFHHKQLVSSLDDDDILYQYSDRFNEENNTIPDFEAKQADPELIKLFVQFASKLNWQQWNHIFKEVARKSDKELRQMPYDYSNVLEETIS